MQIWWWKALLSMGFVIANTHPGREKSIGQQRPKNLDLPSVLPFPLFPDFLLCFKVRCSVFEGRYCTGQDTYWWWVTFSLCLQVSLCLCLEENDKGQWGGGHTRIWRQVFAWKQLDLILSIYFLKQYDFMKNGYPTPTRIQLWFTFMFTLNRKHAMQIRWFYSKGSRT